MWKPLVLLLACAACASPDAEPPGLHAAEDGELAGQLPIDSVYAPSADEAAGWDYLREITADLNGDGQTERLVMAVAIEFDGAGRPMWDDGQRWSVYVETAEQKRTLLYARYVQLGQVEVAVTDSGDGPRVLVYERGPHLRQAWEFAYDGPEVVRVVRSAGGSVLGGAREIIEPAA